MTNVQWRMTKEWQNLNNAPRQAPLSVDLTWLEKPPYLNIYLTTGTALDLKDIKAIVDLMKENDLSVFEMEKDGFKLKLQKGVLEQPVMSSPIVVAPTAAPAAPPAKEAPGAEEAAEGAPLKEIVSPMVGTFYRASSPDNPPFVEIGKAVTEDSVVCIIEAMKVMNEIKAETSGVIAEVVAENGKPVQFGQVLFRVR
jgi:acetyl-CoA carboxylase biotin carboxyl carrier protein